MNKFIQRYLHLAPLLLLLISGSAVQAQDSTGAASGFGTPQSSGEKYLLRMLKVIDQIGVILPGQGFKSIKLGDTREKLISRWGKPEQANRKGLQYQLDPKTSVQFIGKKRIDTILVFGRSGSLARINNGVVFGMSPAQVLETFNAIPDKRSDTRIRYKKLGIELFFEQLALYKIAVFSP